MPNSLASWTRYAASLPERCVRAMFAGVGGAAHEGAQLLLPRMVRRSRLYEVTAKNMLRIAIELLGGVQGAGPAADAGEAVDTAGRVAVKKAAGNVVEFGSIAAFGFSPLWLLAGAADILNGSRVYLRTLEAELIAAGVLPEAARFATVDQLIGALEGTTGRTAMMIDLPPLELAELKRSLAELRADAKSLPNPAEMAALLTALRQTANRERRSLLEVSSGVGLAFLISARNIGRQHIAVPYREDWTPVRDEGFGAYAARVARPYREAVSAHFRPARTTWTERGLDRAQRAWRWARSRRR